MGPDRHGNRTNSPSRSPLDTACVAGFLIIAIVALTLSVPRPADALAGCIAAIGAALGITAGVAAGSTVLSSVTGIGLFVPVIDFPNLTQNTITAVATKALTLKSCADEIATFALKIAINIVRDMVIRWIITGRFEGLVFSASFAADLHRSIENASRIFLSQLTGINFCAGINIPPQAFFALRANLALACTYTGGDLRDLRLGKISDFVSFTSSEASANESWNVLVTILDQKLQVEEVARSSFAAAYQAGQGFLDIRDPTTGKITTPGSAVAKLVMESQIVSPIRQTDVANTTQQAIAAIIDTAVRVFLEKGLAAAFGPGGLEEIEFEAPRRAPPVLTLSSVSSTIQTMQSRTNALLAIPEISIEERDALQAFIVTLNGLETQLANAVSQEEITRISEVVELLNFRLDTTIAATFFCRTQNPSHPLCRSTGALRVVNGVNATPVETPDGDLGGAASTIAITGQLSVVEVTVSVSIDHPSPQQLTIDLTSPQGNTKRLKETGQIALPRTFAATFTASSPFAGRASNGAWRLIVTDTNRDGRQGRLNSWSITIAGRP